MGQDAIGLIGRLNGRVTMWLARVAALILAALCLMTFADVLGRYFFNRPFTFTVEVTELAMGLIVYLAIGLTTHASEHISVDVVTLRLSEGVRALVALLTNLVALAFLAVMVWRVWLRAIDLMAKGDVTQVWRIPQWPVALAMAFGALFLLTGVFLHMATALRQTKGKRGL
jgi:TRAP-type C4-dicarboxylate transport system permease small subunit